MELARSNHRFSGALFAKRFVGCNYDVSRDTLVLWAKRKSRLGNTTTTRLPVRATARNGSTANSTLNPVWNWPNRDPIEEKGGVGLYLFSKNAPVQNIDALGLRWVASGDNPGTVDTIECDGKGGIRVFLTEATGNGCSAARSCRMVHERSHAEDALAENKNICGCSQQTSVKAGTQIAYRGVFHLGLKASERKAYDAEIACVRDKAATGVWGCAEPAEDYIKRLRQDRKQYE